MSIKVSLNEAIINSEFLLHKLLNIENFVESLPESITTASPTDINMLSELMRSNIKHLKYCLELENNWKTPAPIGENIQVPTKLPDSFLRYSGRESDVTTYAEFITTSDGGMAKCVRVSGMPDVLKTYPTSTPSQIKQVEEIRDFIKANGIYNSTTGSWSWEGDDLPYLSLSPIASAICGVPTCNGRDRIKSI